MSELRKSHFLSAVDASSQTQDAAQDGIWQLPDSILEDVFGGANFNQSGGGYSSFAQNFSCFAQNIGNFSQGQYPG